MGAKVVLKGILKYGLPVVTAVVGLITGIKDQQKTEAMKEMNANILNLTEALNKTKE